MVKTDFLIKEILKKLNDKILIKVLPFDVTEQLCKDIKDMKDIRCCVVSIDDYGFKPTDIHEGGSIKKIFRMKFPDIDICDAPNIMKYLATEEDIKGLKNFIDTIKNDCNFLIVHCAAGISRSPAIASVIEEYLGQKDTIWNSGKYQPNRHVYKLTLQEFGIQKTEEEINEKYKALQNQQENEDDW